MAIQYTLTRESDGFAIDYFDNGKNVDQRVNETVNDPFDVNEAHALAASMIPQYQKPVSEMSDDELLDALHAPVCLGVLVPIEYL